MTVRQLDPQAKRVETGPIRFGEDWCGVFIRGDNAAGYAQGLDELLKHSACTSWVAKGLVQGLLDVLRSCDERGMK